MNINQNSFVAEMKRCKCCALFAGNQQHRTPLNVTERGEYKSGAELILLTARLVHQLQRELNENREKSCLNPRSHSFVLHLSPLLEIVDRAYLSMCGWVTAHCLCIQAGMIYIMWYFVVSCCYDLKILSGVCGEKSTSFLWPVKWQTNLTAEIVLDDKVKL